MSHRSVQAAPGGEAREAVLHALRAGYRHIDTAALYDNEADVGAAVRDSGVPREEVFITTKLWNSDHGYEEAQEAARTSLRKLGLDYVDLYLVHAPVPGGRLESHRGLEQLQRDGLARSIGVSNFGVHHLEELLSVASVPPAVNQVEVSPFLTREELTAFCSEHGIIVEAYSPLTKGRRLGDPTVAAVAASHGVTAAQVLLRWSLQNGYVVLPKSVTPSRIEENADIFGFSLSVEDMKRLDGLNDEFVTGWDPTVWE